LVQAAQLLHLDKGTPVVTLILLGQRDILEVVVEVLER
jgi:hypothetical protein